MNMTPYGKGVTYAATTSKYDGLSRQLTLNVEIATPEFYEEQKIEKVLAIVDTGATRSVISKSFAGKLGLQPTGIGKTGGVGGVRTTELFDIVLHLNSHVRNIKLQVSEGRLHRDDVEGPPDSDVAFLVGMDVLGHGDLFTGQYKDKDGKPCTMFTFRIPTAYMPVDYLQEIQNHNKEQLALQAKIDASKFRMNQGGNRKPNKRHKKR